MQKITGLSQNVAGMLAYITFVPAVIFLILEPYNKNRFVRFHAFQSIFLSVAAFLVDWILKLAFSALSVFALILLPVMWLFGFLYLSLLIVCILNAYQNQKLKLPILGNLAEEQAERV